MRISPAGAVPPSADATKVREAAQAFVATTIGALLAPMFETVDSAKGMFGGGAGEETWKPMLIAEFGKHIAAQGGFGLTEQVTSAMLRIQETQPPRTMRPTR